MVPWLCLASFQSERSAYLSATLHFLHYLVFVGAGSIYFCYFLAKRFPYFTLGLVVIAACFALIVIDIVASFLLNLDNVWIDGIDLLIPVLLPLGSLLLFWLGVKKSRAERGEK